MWIELDNSESVPPVDFSERLCLDVGPAHVNGAHPPCGKDSENLFTYQATKMACRKSNPYIGEFVFWHPHMGGILLTKLANRLHFST